MLFSNLNKSSPWDNPHFGPPPCYTLESADDVYRPIFDLCFEYFNGTQVQGDIYEFGTYKGYTARLISENMALRNWEGKLHLFDSFEGLSELQPVDVPNDWDQRYKGTLGFTKDKLKEQFSCPLQTVRDNLSGFSFIRYYEGWIPTRFHEIVDRYFSFVHLDFGLYQPVYESFQFLYPRLKQHGIMVFDDSRDILSVAREGMAFFAEEACGKCFPCRIGTQRLTERLAGEAGPQDVDLWLEEVSEIGETMKAVSACGLGIAAPLITESLMRFFPEAVERHVGST